MELLVILILVLLNGIFAMSELSIVSSRKFKLENALKKGKASAKVALELSENPNRFLSTVQIGITLIGILLGVYSGENLTNNVVTFLSQFNLEPKLTQQIATGLVVLFITYISIVLGELFPKRIGMTFPEPIAIIVAQPMKWLSKIAMPFVWLLTSTNDLLLKIFGIKKTTDSIVTEEEIKSIIADSTDSGEIKEIEQDIVERVFNLGDKSVRSLYTPRMDVIYLKEFDTIEQVLQKLNDDPHSAYPLCVEDNLDEVIGVVALKDLIHFISGKDNSLRSLAKPPLYIIESSNAYKVLEEFKKNRRHYGIVIDEFGVTKGVVTLDDIIDALVGDISEIESEEYAIKKMGENEWLVDGFYSCDEFIKEFEIDYIVDEKHHFTTIAGLIINIHDGIPEEGDKVIIGDYQLEVIDKDSQRIDKIRVTKVSS